jgi:hypothetical protein
LTEESRKKGKKKFKEIDFDSSEEEIPTKKIKRISKSTIQAIVGSKRKSYHRNGMKRTSESARKISLCGLSLFT